MGIHGFGLLVLFAGIFDIHRGLSFLFVGNIGRLLYFHHRIFFWSSRDLAIISIWSWMGLVQIRYSDTFLQRDDA